MTQSVAVKLLDPRAKMPTYGSVDAAGADLYAVTDGPVTVAPGETVLVHTGLALAIPQSRGWRPPTRWGSLTPTTGAS